MADSILSSISLKSKELAQRIMDLAIGRVFKNIHLKLSKEEQLIMEKTFESGSDEEKENFIKKYIPEFQNIFRAELANIEEELKGEI